VSSIDFFEMKILSNIFGPSQAKEVWILIQNKKIHRLCDDVACRTFLRLKSVQCAGLVVKIDDSYVRQKVMDGCFVGRSRMGKPRVRWEDAVWKGDVHLLQI
jgi:hypothetical protein